jgi:pyruvate formate-lyase/glycerol dehydratase family glycyl radical enzyme
LPERHHPQDRKSFITSLDYYRNSEKRLDFGKTVQGFTYNSDTEFQKECLLMFTLSPVSDRVKKMREKYRSTKPKVCTARLKIVTDFYRENPQISGILKRALVFKEIAEKTPVLINEDEVIVGSMASTYRGSALFPENDITWIKADYETGRLFNRPIDPYIIDDADFKYIMSVIPYWSKNSLSALTDQYIPEGYFDCVGNQVTVYNGKNICCAPVGHFCSNYDKAIRVGFGAVREEARIKMAELEGTMDGDTVLTYNFYRSVAITCGGMITLAKRYATEAVRQAGTCQNPVRKAELEMMADSLNWIMEHPARTFYEAAQAMFLYQIGLCLHNNMHGISFGRVDQYLGSFYEADIAAGRITHERAQEIYDLLALKVAEMNKIWSYGTTLTVSGYTVGQLMTLGGVDKKGNDATNAVSFMMLQTAARLALHDPPLSLRVHAHTPQELWEAALETTRFCGGVPTFENDEVIIPALVGRGMSLESARNYCLIGCVEPGGTGDEWPACGGSGGEAYWNMPMAFVHAINDGHNPMPDRYGNKSERRTGAATGYLYQMETFDDVLNAVKTQYEYFLKWQMSMVNMFEVVAAEHMAQPLVSCMMDGCMKSGRDVMRGGAKFNSCGVPGVGIGNAVDCLAITKYMVYDKKLCTAKELYDAIISNWEGKEDLRQFILNEAPHYGNDNEYCDQWADWITGLFADIVTSFTSIRGCKFAPGLYPVATNVLWGMFTPATPDGRKAGDPLSDGISPVQQLDKNGPTATLKSVCQIPQIRYSNGTLLNMKFHPTALGSESGQEKLKALIRTYFDMGGMELQINVVSSELLRKAQQKPEDYRDLVVRVAGFSAYFVELFKNCQDDLIRRTELNL